MSDALNVVLLEDDAGDAELFRRTLREAYEGDLDLQVHDRPEDAFGSLATATDAVVFLDYLLGRTTGLNVLKRLRATGHSQPVVMLTGQGDEEVAAECMRAGAADYLPKAALSSERLRTVIIQVLQQRQLQREVATLRREIELKRDELEHRNQQIREFLHTIAHELRNPLSAAWGFVAQVHDCEHGPLSPEQTAPLGRALECFDQMTRHLTDLGDIARVETGKLTLQSGPCAIGPVVSLAVDVINGAAQERGLRVQWQPSAVPLVDADELRLGQVVTNLLTNALKFTPSGGTITVEVSEPPEADGFVRVAVSDSGIGIPDGEIDRVFERLYQVNGGPGVLESGLGIGLSLCREIVRRHGGEITAESTLGYGSTFSFTIPVFVDTTGARSSLR